MRLKSLLLSFALVAAAAHADEPPPNWSALAAADVEAAYKETRENHAGMYDVANPGFAKQLEKARTEGLKLAKRSKSAAGFEASLTRFRAVLDDGHAGAYAALPEQFRPKVRWPGFVAAWRGDAMYVYKSAEGGPAAGTQITACDGMPIANLVKRKVFKFRTGVKIPGEWWSSARLALIDDGNPFVTLPKSCVFKQGSQTATRQLNWSPIPEYYGAWRNGSINGDLLAIGMIERAPGIQWIAMPDFQPDDEGVAAYKKLYSDIEATLPKLQQSRAIVLDLRYNEGGSSNWSKMLAERLWGKARVAKARKAYFAKTQTWWRPTEGNLGEVKQFVNLLETQGDMQTAGLVKMFIPLFENAIAANEKYLVEPDVPAGMDDGADADPAELKTPVYVVVPGQCASACLDAIDTFKLFPNIRLIGAPSSADSTYMEVRNPALPSGMANAIIPMKMYVDRPRGNGVHYEPDILMADFDWSTENFLKRIEADLAAR
jgi:Peptidase family S41